jgi:hypothetical protein
MKMIQLLPLGNPDNVPFALIGLDDEGRIWYSKVGYEKSPDRGPTSVVWRPVGAEKL